MAGYVTAVTDPTGAVSRTAYDVLGRPVTRTDPEGRTTTLSYDAAGNITTVAAPGGRVTRYAYDAEGRVTARVDPRGAVAGGDAGRFTTRFGYDLDGNQTTVADPLGGLSTTAFDAAGRRVSVVDAGGRATSWSYDRVGRLAGVTGPTGAVTGYAYDAAGQLVTRTEPGGRQSTFTYGLDGLPATEVSPAGRETSYGYDVNGNRTTVVRPSGNATASTGDGTLTTSYDTLGRPTGIDFSDGTPDVAVTYDAAGRLSRAGQAPPGGVVDTVYGYDAAGRPTSITRGAERATYGWNGAGQLTSRGYADGRSFTYGYHDDGFLAALTPAAPGAATTYDWDLAGQLAAVTRPGEIVTTYTYDAAGQNTGLTHAKGAAPLVEHAVAFTLSGEPQRVTTTRAGESTSALYSYTADQLAGVCRPASGTTCTSTSPQVAYTYDALGRRVTETPTNISDGKALTYTYDTADQLSTVTDPAGAVVEANTWGVDGNLTGRTTSAGVRTFTYGLDDNLTAVRLEDGRTLDYTYDADGNRLTRTVDGVRDTTWVWDRLADQLGIRIGEYDAAGAAVHAWTPDPVSGLATALADTAGVEPRWLLSDPLGNLTDTATSSAGLTGTATVHPFGDEPAPPTGAAAGNPLRFHGQYLDEMTGLYDIRARDYDPDRGVFTAVDPIDPHPGLPYLTTYHYGRNSPLTLADPTGQWPGWLRDAGSGALGVGDSALGLGQDLWAVGSMRPDELAGAVKQSWDSGYADEGLGGAINQFNPAYHALVNGEKGWQLALDGCVRQSAEAFTDATFSIAETTALAAGGLGATRSAIPKSSRTPGDTDAVPPQAAEAGSKLVQGARYPLAPKIQGQLGNRGWTTETIDEAVQSGLQVRAVNKATGNPATRHVHPATGQSVVIDDITGQVIHVGGPGFKYGPGSGDLP